MLINESAVASLAEGLEETLTLHRLAVFPELGRSLRTTNCPESINTLVEQRTGKSTIGATAIRSSIGWRRRCWTSSPDLGGSEVIVTCRYCAEQCK